MNPISIFKNPLLIFEVVVFSVLMIYGYYRHPHLDFWTVSSSVFFLAGGALNFIARYNLGDAFSLRPRAKYLVNRGLYTKLRHPIYYSVYLIYIGLSLLFRHWVIYLLFAIIICIQTFRIKKEEKLLAATFGQKYQNYKNSTWF